MNHMMEYGARGSFEDMDRAVKAVIERIKELGYGDFHPKGLPKDPQQRVVIFARCSPSRIVGNDVIHVYRKPFATLWATWSADEYKVHVCEDIPFQPNTKAIRTVHSLERALLPEPDSVVVHQNRCFENFLSLFKRRIPGGTPSALFTAIVDALYEVHLSEELPGDRNIEFPWEICERNHEGITIWEKRNGKYLLVAWAEVWDDLWRWESVITSEEIAPLLANPERAEELARDILCSSRKWEITSPSEKRYKKNGELSPSDGFYDGGRSRA